MFPFFLIALLATIQTKLTIVDSPISSYEDAVCQKYLKTHVTSFNSEITCSQIDTRIVSTVSHMSLAPGCAGLYVKAYTMTSNSKIEITDIANTDDSSNLYIYIGLSISDIQDQRKCNQVATDPDYITRECLIVIEYINPVRDFMMKSYSSSVTVQISRHAKRDPVVGNSIFEEGYDWKIDESLQYKVTLYRSDCKTVIKDSRLLIYGEEICFSIIGEDPLSQNTKLEVTQLTVTCNREGEADKTINMMSVTTIMCSLENVCMNGQVFVILPVINVGRLTFTFVIVLNDIGSPKRTIINFLAESIINSAKSEDIKMILFMTTCIPHQRILKT
jgi:hypothetical protein